MNHNSFLIDNVLCLFMLKIHREYLVPLLLKKRHKIEQRKKQGSFSCSKFLFAACIVLPAERFNFTVWRFSRSLVRVETVQATGQLHKKEKNNNFEDTHVWTSLYFLLESISAVAGGGACAI